jgi:phage/plasmid-like protein (TIGR03299 family)
MPKDGTFSGLVEKSVATLDEACKEFGLDREVEKRQLFYPDENGEMLLSPYDMQTVDVESNRPLGVVGNMYEVVPYRIAFSPAEPLIENGAKIMGGGAPHWGETGYLRMRAPGSFKVGRHEILNDYLLRSSHDGTGKIEVRSTPYFTANRVAMTVDASHPLSFKHTRNVNTRIGRARDIFRRVNENWNEFQAGVQKMIAHPLSDVEARRFIEQLTPSKSGGTRIDNIREDIYTLYKHTGRARVLPQCRGTLFGLVQGVAEWADLHRTIRKSSKRDVAAATLDARLVNDAAKKKQKAWAMSLWLMNNSKLSGASPAGN